jgi:hypothetical protein
MTLGQTEASLKIQAQLQVYLYIVKRDFWNTDKNFIKFAAKQRNIS